MTQEFLRDERSRRTDRIGRVHQDDIEALRRVGQELDIIASGKFRPGVGLSAGLGYFKPGTFLKSTTPGKPYTYPYVMLTYDF